MAVSFIFNLKIYLFGNIVLIRNLKYIQKLINLLKFGCIFFLGSVKNLQYLCTIKKKVNKNNITQFIQINLLR